MSPAPRQVLIPEELPPVRLPADAQQELRWEGQTMGTVWRVRAFADAAGRERFGGIRRGIEERLGIVVRQMSHFDPDSDLSRFNRAPAGAWVRLPEPFFRVLRCALEISAASQGWFDPTLGELVSLWGFGPGGQERDPELSETLQAAERCGWARLHIDAARRAARQPGGLQLNLSAIAKGFAVDQVAAWLRSCGIESALVEIGGEFSGWGVKPDGSPWWVELENPPHGAGDVPQTMVALCGLSVASSGDWVQRRRAGRRSVSHLIDPLSGYPVDGATAGASVLQESCMLADAWATALCVAPPRAAMRLAELHGLAARLLLRSPCGRICEWLSPALRAMAK